MPASERVARLLQTAPQVLSDIVAAVVDVSSGPREQICTQATIRGRSDFYAGDSVYYGRFV